MGGVTPAYNKIKQDVYINMGDKHRHSFNKNGVYELDWTLIDKNKVDKIYKNKLIKIFANDLINFPNTSGLNIVFMKRNIEEIKTSFYYFFPKNTNIFLNYKEALNIIRKREDVVTLNIFDYHDVLTSPFKCFSILKNSGWNIDVGKCMTGIDQSLCHFKFNIE